MWQHFDFWELSCGILAFDAKGQKELFEELTEYFEVFTFCIYVRAYAFLLVNINTVLFSES